MLTDVGLVGRPTTLQWKKTCNLIFPSPPKNTTPMDAWSVCDSQCF